MLATICFNKLQVCSSESSASPAAMLLVCWLCWLCWCFFSRTFWRDLNVHFQSQRTNFNDRISKKWPNLEGNIINALDQIILRDRCCVYDYEVGNNVSDVLVLVFIVLVNKTWPLSHIAPAADVWHYDRLVIKMMFERSGWCWESHKTHKFL